MKKLENLKSEIENLFKKNGFDENIEFRISNVDDYDLQINNMVKHQDIKNIDLISLELKKILNSNDDILMNNSLSRTSCCQHRSQLNHSQRDTSCHLK